MNPDFINPLVLAYLGDSVLELLVREYLIKNDLQKVNELYQKATHYVSSKAHEDFILYILEQNFLTEKEVGIFKGEEIQKPIKEIRKNIVIQQDLNV